MRRLTLVTTIVALIAGMATLMFTGPAAAEGEGDELVNLACISESLIGTPISESGPAGLCQRIAYNQNCVGTGEDRVCDDDTPWPEFTFDSHPYVHDNGIFNYREVRHQEQIWAADIVERSMSTHCEAEPTGAHRSICRSEPVSRAHVNACHAAVLDLEHNAIHDLATSQGTVNCGAPPSGSARPPASAQARSEEPEIIELTAPPPPEPVAMEQRSDTETSETSETPETTTVIEPAVDRLTYAATKIEEKTGWTCTVSDGRIDCTQ